MVRLTVRIDVLEKHAVLQSTSRIEELIKIFVHATRVCILCHNKDLQSAYVSCRWRPVSGVWGMINARWDHKRSKRFDIITSMGWK